MNEGEIITNSSFDFFFAGKNYALKKANLKQVIDFQRKAAEIGAEKDPAGDLRIVAYAIYLALSATDPAITEEYVMLNCPGDVDVMDIFTTLGFMNQQKVEMMTKFKDSLVNRLGGEKSLEL